MAIKLEEKINYLADELNYKMEIKASYLMWNLGLETGRNIQTITEFYKFCNNFFNVWERYLKRISPLLDEFKREENARPLYAEILGKQYEKYLQSLKNLKAPAMVNRPFKLFLDSVSGRKSFFESYDDKKAKKICNYSDEHEYRFWLTLYKKNTEIRSLPKKFSKDDRKFAAVKG